MENKLRNKLVVLGLLIFILILIFSYNSSSRADSNSSMRVYNAAGTEQLNTHIVYGYATLVAGSVIITLGGNAVFTNSSSYKCTVTDAVLNLTAVSYTSGTQFTINGVLTDQVSFSCIGN
jgi:hypothetical protein